MFFQRIKSEGLAHISYLLGSGNSAVVVDPRRDIDTYVNLAREHGFKIDYILETHRNEDYVIGSIELARLSGARIYHGSGLDWKYGQIAGDGEEFGVGRLVLRAMYTPGHTRESVSYVLFDRGSGPAPVGVFSGDALFVGTTGRIDIYGPVTAPEMAGDLWESIFKRLLPLGDGVILWPAHGAGSVCGIGIADRDESTLGIERLQNRDLQIKENKAFIQNKLAEDHVLPPYFRQMELYNLSGPPPSGRPSRPRGLTAREFNKHLENGTLIVDTSLPNAYAGAHIPGSYNIWLEGLSGYAGWFLNYDQPLLLVLGDPVHLDQATTQLYRMGFDNIAGFLNDGMESWYNSGYPFATLPLMTVQTLKDKMDRGENLFLVDVRRKSEFHNAHIAGALNIFVGQLEQRLSEVPRDRPVVVYCSVGRRASIGASILLRSGYKNVYNLAGSITAWKNAGYSVTQEE